MQLLIKKNPNYNPQTQRTFNEDKKYINIDINNEQQDKIYVNKIINDNLKII